MKTLFLLSLFALPLSAQPQQAAPPQDIAKLSDEFSAAESLAAWSRFDSVEGWPDMLKRAEIKGGNLLLEPWTSGWYAEFHAPYLFKEISGSFVATARVRVRGKEAEIPSEPWSLAGLMVREPRPASGKNWQPRGENWLFLTTGIAHETGKPVFETKTTVNSRSNLKLHPARSGWVDLRIVRLGPNFILMSRYDGEPWQVRERFFRLDLPRTVQVGLNVYTGWNSALDFENKPEQFNTTVLKDRKADAILEVDYIRFAKPPIPQGVDLATLTDYTMSNAELVKLFGV
ncbi:MAG TPA: hypothetical protein VGF48_14595 [Thermoanaerobaculia bacterium]|jgi:hypothetical protein